MNIKMFKADSRRMLRLSAEVAGHVWRLYLTRDMKMRKTQARDNDREKTIVLLKNALIKERGERCEICGVEVKKYMQMHHALPYERFPELADDRRNMMLLCPECHNEIHSNAYLQIDIMEKRGKALDVDVRAVYGNPPFGK